MDRIAFSLLGLSVAALFFSSCKENACDQLVKEVTTISNDAFGKLPYTGFDTLVFVDESADTSMLIGQGKVMYYEETTKPVTPTCLTPILDQAFKISFRPIKGNLSFDVYQKSNGKNIVLTVPVLPVHFYINYLTVGDQSPLNIDSLTISGFTYKNVSKATAKDVTFNIIDDTYTAYYNLPYGVIYVKSSKEGKTYWRIPNN